MPNDADITGWIIRLKEGDSQAAEVLWQAYFQRIVALAHRQLGLSSRRVEDEEDVAVKTFHSVYRRAATGQFPRLNDRNDLWNLLVKISARKAANQRKFHRRQKRGGGLARVESVFARPGESGDGEGMGHVEAPEPTPEFAAMVAEMCRDLLDRLPNEKLRGIAVRKMEGYTNEEIAQQLGCTKRTIERKLRLIREHWSERELEGAG